MIYPAIAFGAADATGNASTGRATAARRHRGASRSRTRRRDIEKLLFILFSFEGAYLDSRRVLRAFRSSETDNKSRHGTRLSVDSRKRGLYIRHRFSAVKNIKKKIARSESPLLRSRRRFSKSESKGRRGFRVRGEPLDLPRGRAL